MPPGRGHDSSGPENVRFEWAPPVTDQRLNKNHSSGDSKSEQNLVIIDIDREFAVKCDSSAAQRLS